MMTKTRKIGLGGGCYWCTEAVFQQLNGIHLVEQGFIKSLPPDDFLSEGVIVHYNPQHIALIDLFEIHLHTHKSTSSHSLRHRYRSAVYCFEEEDANAFAKALPALQQAFDKPIITRALAYAGFQPSPESIQDYYQKRPDAPFCKRYIQPKLKLLETSFNSKLAR